MGKEIKEILGEKVFLVAYSILPTLIYLSIATYYIGYILANLPCKIVNWLEGGRLYSYCYEID